MNSSYCRSWHYAVPGFEQALEYIRTCSQDDGNATIWQTRHKRVVTFDIPENIPVDESANRKTVWKYYGEQRFFRYLFRPSLALREWRGYQRVRALGIPVAVPLALGETRRGLRQTGSFFITRLVVGCSDGGDFFPDGKRKDESAAMFEFAVKNLQLLAKLHRAGLVHGGFHPRNELYTVDENGSIQIIWIDLATCKKPPFFKRRKLQQKDLKMFLEPFALSAEKTEELLKVYQDALK